LCDDEEKIRMAFEFVRDRINHSGDINSDRMAKSASEVLFYGEGICLAKLAFPIRIEYGALTNITSVQNVGR